MEHQEEPTRRPLFSLGDVVITPYLARHQQGAWGQLDPDDIRANDHALTVGARLLSAYQLPDTTTIWIITEADVRHVMA